MTHRIRLAAVVLLAAAWLVVAPAVGVGDSVVFSNGDMAVLDQGTTGKHLYYVPADGSAKTLMGTYGGSNLWDVAFTPEGQLIVAYDTTMYRVDPGNFTPASPGTPLTVTGTAPGGNVGFDGVDVGPTGTIYIDAYNNGQNRYFRLTSTGVDAFNATPVGAGVNNNWQVAVETDAPGAAELLGFSNNNLYRMSEASGTNTQLNGSALLPNPYSIAYDETNDIVYAGSYSATSISMIDVATGTTTQSWINMGNPVRGMDFSDGLLYAVKTTSNGGIFTIDPGTALPTQLGSVTFDSPRAIAVFQAAEQAVPEPATIVLLGLAACGLGGYACLRRKA